MYTPCIRLLELKESMHSIYRGYAKQEIVQKRGKTWTYTTHTKNFLSVNIQITCLYNIHQKDTSTRYKQNKYTNMYIATCKRSCLNSKILSECFLERIV